MTETTNMTEFHIFSQKPQVASSIFRVMPNVLGMSSTTYLSGFRVPFSVAHRRSCFRSAVFSNLLRGVRSSLAIDSAFSVVGTLKLLVAYKLLYTV